MSDRALQMYENASNKRPSNEEMSAKMQLLNEKRNLSIELDQKNALLENQKKSTDHFKNLYNNKKEELKDSHAKNQALKSDLDHANATIQELRSEIESLNKNQQVTKKNKKNKQREKPCPHGNSRSAR